MKRLFVLILIASMLPAMQQQESYFQRLSNDLKREHIKYVIYGGPNFDDVMKNLVGTLQNPGFEFLDQKEIEKIVYEINKKWDKSLTDIFQRFQALRLHYAPTNVRLNKIINYFGSTLKAKDAMFSALSRGEVDNLKRLLPSHELILKMILNDLFNAKPSSDYNYSTVISTLIKAGINPNYKTDQITLLNLAIRVYGELWNRGYYGYNSQDTSRRDQADMMKENIKQLIKAGANVNEQIENPNRAAIYSYKPLELAQNVANDPEIIKWLVDAGAK